MPLMSVFKTPCVAVGFSCNINTLHVFPPKV